MGRFYAWITAAAVVVALATTTVDAKYKVIEKLAQYLPGADGVELFSDIMYPDPSEVAPNTTFPVILFPNSWGCPEFEYVLKNKRFAELGYVTLEYATRGWWLSGGEIDVAGPLDRADGSALIDWVVANAATLGADPTRIGFAGISYGAGISLQMAGFDSRVKCAVAMSGWANLSANVYYDHSTSLTTVHTLISIANKSGRPSPGMEKVFAELTSHKNISGAIAYGAVRGADMFVDEINARQVPILMSNNYIDRIFYPQLMTETFWNALTGPKHMLSNCGGHAIAEGLGIVGLKNHVWTRAREWFDFWLRNDSSSGINTRPPVSFQLEGSIFTETFQEFSAWPAPSSELQWQRLYFSPRGNNQLGGLRRSPPSASPTAEGTESIYFTKNAPIWDGEGKTDEKSAFFGEYATFNLSALSTRHAISYVAAPFNAPTRVCGVPHMDVVFNASSTRWQLYGYLMQMSPGAGEGNAYLLSDASVTRWGDTASDSQVAVRLHFHTMCRDFNAGDAVAVSFVLYEKRFATANADASLNVFLDTSAGASTLSIPIALDAKP